MSCQSHVLILSFDLGKRRGSVFILQSSVTSPKADPSMSLRTGAKVTGKILILHLWKSRRPALSVACRACGGGALYWKTSILSTWLRPGCCRVTRQQQGWQQDSDKSPWGRCICEIPEGHRSHPQLVTVLLGRLLSSNCEPLIARAWPGLKRLIARASWGLS